MLQCLQSRVYKWLKEVVGVDGYYLRGCFNGITLKAVGQDAKDCIYPVV